MIKETITIMPEQAGTRIDALCTSLYPEYTRSHWSKYGMFVMGIRKYSSGTKTKEGQEWKVSCLEGPADMSHIAPWDYDLNVLHESKTWLAIEKPRGISMHPSQSEKSQQTIVNALVGKWKALAERKETIDGVEVSRPGLVHRLDKETSGVVLIAKTNQTLGEIQKHWDSTEKIYTAVVKGVPPVKGKIDAPITRDPKNRQLQTVMQSETAKDAVTYFERIATKDKYSLLRIRIPTGRMHQIRVHLTSIGFSIVGDNKYGGIDAPRMMLHATEITFADPDKGGECITVVCEYPKVFDTYVS